MNAATQLSVRTAYLAMFEFLSRYWDRGHAEEIGALLGALSLLPDGHSADAALYQDFEESVKEVLRGEAAGGYLPANLKLNPPAR